MAVRSSTTQSSTTSSTRTASRLTRTPSMPLEPAQERVRRRRRRTARAAVLVPSRHSSILRLPCLLLPAAFAAMATLLLPLPVAQLVPLLPFDHHSSTKLPSKFRLSMDNLLVGSPRKMSEGLYSYAFSFQRAFSPSEGLLPSNTRNNVVMDNLLL